VILEMNLNNNVLFALQRPDGVPLQYFLASSVKRSHKTNSMKKNLPLLAILLSLAFTSQAQFYKYSNEFLAIGVGARGLSMSGAVIASTNDITSSY